jgi:hypothetical protein
MPLLPRKNYFDVLAVEEIEKDSSTTTDVSPVSETARTKKPQKSKIEKGFQKGSISALPKSVQIPSTFG